MITIEVWSDINCPFCYIGKRHLEAALKSFQGQVDVEWKSFELDPSSQPEKGVSQVDLIAQKYGKDRSWVIQMNKNITEMAKESGLDFKMDQLIPANSFNAHRLIHLAKSAGKQDEMKEALLKARFVDGLDIGDSTILTNVATGIGLSQTDVEEVLASVRYVREVRLDEQMASELGIRGVPFFVINKKYTLSGAQPVNTFKEVLSSIKSELA